MAGPRKKARSLAPRTAANPEHMIVPARQAIPHLSRSGLPGAGIGAGADRRQMERARDRAARRRPAAIQRVEAEARRHLAADAEAHGARPGARRARHADDISDHSAARRLRADQAGAGIDKADAGAGAMG